jgi:hypothetical protein
MLAQGSRSEAVVALELIRIRWVLDSLVTQIHRLPRPQQARATVLLLETLMDAGVACGRGLPAEEVA